MGKWTEEDEPAKKMEEPFAEKWQENKFQKLREKQVHGKGISGILYLREFMR